MFLLMSTKGSEFENKSHVQYYNNNSVHYYCNDISTTVLIFEKNDNIIILYALH